MRPVDKIPRAQTRSAESETRFYLLRRSGAK
jgi:hypothetical protein